MTDQLSIFDLPLIPDEPSPPILDPPPLLPHLTHRRDWLEGNAAFYLRLIGRFMDLQIRDRVNGVVNSKRNAVRMAEISRLFLLKRTVSR
ncbi:MAG: hypothetical protein HC781_22705 [Leptolyngbyaceae cyanobacterium CSU_1_4]|nr:hypothetical protein [Leptolyngbyaceae cyanobacterium CSU_1_4]